MTTNGSVGALRLRGNNNGPRAGGIGVLHVAHQAPGRYVAAGSSLDAGNAAGQHCPTRQEVLSLSLSLYSLSLYSTLGALCQLVQEQAGHRETAGRRETA